MAVNGTIAQRITDLIGSQYSTDADYAGDFINAAINEIADMVSEDLLLKYSRTPGELTSNSEWLVEGRKILKVTRIDLDSSGIERECKSLGRDMFSAAGDSGSIHFATAFHLFIIWIVLMLELLLLKFYLNLVVLKEGKYGILVM